MHVCMMLIMIGALSVYKLEKNIFTEKKNHFRLHFIDHQWSMVIFHSFRFLYVCFQFWPMAMDYNHHHQFFPCLFSFVSFSFDSYKNRKQKIFLISDCHFPSFPNNDHHSWDSSFFPSKKTFQLQSNTYPKQIYNFFISFHL